MARLIWVFLLSAFGIAEIQAFINCTLPLIRVGEKAYYVESKDKQTWYDANERCIRAGLQLATIDSEYKFNELADFLSTMGYRADWIWVGGFGRQGSWLQFGQARPLPYAKWYTSQPDNLNSENCMNLYRMGEPWFMNDYSCRSKLSYICEHDTTRIYYTLSRAPQDSSTFTIGEN